MKILYSILLILFINVPLHAQTRKPAPPANVNAKLIAQANIKLKEAGVVGNIKSIGWYLDTCSTDECKAQCIPITNNKTLDSIWTNVPSYKIISIIDVVDGKYIRIHNDNVSYGNSETFYYPKQDPLNKPYIAYTDESWGEDGGYKSNIIYNEKGEVIFSEIVYDTYTDPENMKNVPGKKLQVPKENIPKIFSYEQLLKNLKIKK